MPALLNKVNVNSISDKPPLNLANRRKGTVSQFISMNRYIPYSLRIYTYTQAALILMFLVFDIVTFVYLTIFNIDVYIAVTISRKFCVILTEK